MMIRDSGLFFPSILPFLQPLSYSAESSLRSRGNLSNDNLSRDGGNYLVVTKLKWSPVNP